MVRKVDLLELEMNDHLPHGADGDALRRLAETGSDMSKEMEIDFAVEVPDQHSGLAFAAVVGAMGFRTRVSHDSVTGEWTCYCSRAMVPSYDAVVAVQRALEQAGRTFNARPDGWGSYGNAEAAK